MKACAFILTLGKRHEKLAPSSYKTCITATQAQELFGTTKRPKALGCGVFACVFEHKDPGKVVKITRDPSDVAGLLKGQGLPQVPKVYASHKLAGQPRWTTPRVRQFKWQEWPDEPEAFALIVEKLRVLTGSEKSKWQQRIARMHRFKRQEESKRKIIAAGGGKTAPPDPFAKTKSYTRPTISDMAKAVCPKRPLIEAASCALRIRELNKMATDLRERGVDWVDIHAGNIGVDKNGRWKAIDLGAATTKLDVDLPELADRSRRR
jgi:hypothetical protein